MKKYVFGADIGGTTVKLGLFSSEGELLEKWEIPTDLSDNGGNILPDVAASIHGKMKEKGIADEEVEGLGLDVPGPIDKNGNVLRCVNLGWGVFNVEDRMEKICGFPCKVGNDANVAAFGEMYKGAAQGHENVVMVTLGTGVGGGVIIEGKIVPGTNGAGGEIGHIPVRDDETEYCGCGKQGCLEQYASARGFARQVQKRLASGTEESSLRGYEEFTGKEIFDEAKKGDAFSLQMVDELGKLLGRACAQIACVTDPEVFVIGGGLSKAGSILTDAIQKYYRHYAFHASKETPFVLAKLGNDAGIYGGVKMVLDSHQ